MSFTLYRLELGDPGIWHEQLGDEITNTGGAPVPAIRSALRHEASLFTFGPESNGETTETRLRLRRQLRSLMNNTPFKVTGLFVHWPTDPEQDGWYMPDKGQLEDGEGSTGIATGYFKIAQFVWFKVGAPRTHRKAMWVYLKDLRTGLFARDYRRLIYTTAFSALETLPLTYLPPGAMDAASAASGATASLYTLPTGFDGGACQLAVGLVDNLRVSFEQSVASRNLGQVIAYDRRGTFTAPSKEVGTGWEEIYGPDYPYKWVEGGEIDAPVLTNGRCRVRYNKTLVAPCFTVDVWSGTEWVEQGSFAVWRETGVEKELLSAQLIEYSETRAVIQAVMTTGSPGSREVLYITLQRGWSGPRIEVYPSLESEGVQAAEIAISFFLAGEDINDGALKIDSTGGSIVSTAAQTNKYFLGPTQLGAATFTLENEVMVIRQGREYAVNVAVVQALNTCYLGTGTGFFLYPIGSRGSEIRIQATTHAGYVRADINFYPLVAQQIMEAESMTLGIGTTTETDTNASAGVTTKGARTTDTHPHVTQAAWPNNKESTPVGHTAKYRIFARVRTGAGTLEIYAKTSLTTGATKKSTSNVYVWIDLGDIETNGGELAIHCWVNASAEVRVDRIEAFKVEDRASAQPEYNGGRDLGQSVLLDSRTIPTVVTRST